MAETVYILLGSDLGNREQYLETARQQMAEVEGLEVIRISSIYHSEAEGMASDAPPFLNQVVQAEYQFTPGALMASLEEIEHAFGRTDKGKRLPRTIDLDILLFGNHQIATDRLTIPHKELLRRPFALVPLLEIAPDVIHPGKDKPIAGYLTEQDRARVLLYKEHVTR